MNVNITKNVLWSGILLMMVACGGGGGGESADTGVSYTGNTSQATLTDTNAGPISKNVLDNGGEGGALVLSATNSNTSENPGTPQTLTVSRTIKDIAAHIEANPGIISTVNSLAVTTLTDTLTGDCGGSATMTFSGDTNGSFTGSMSFSSYCNGNETLSGTITISGVADGNSQVTSLTMTFVRLTFISGSESSTATGRVVLDALNNTVTIEHMVMHDNANSKTYMVINYSITSIDYGSYEEVTISSGTFYDFDYGYVDVVTVTPFLINYGDEYPYAGSLKIMANNGASAVLAAVDATTYTLDIDKDGNGTYETFQTGPWANL